jgi:ubiquinone/menaquinone biosynthesis C-methylase UbiE
MAQYGQPQYWEERYTKDPEPFDWYQRYEQLRETLRSVVPVTSSILVTGCGNSRLTEDMLSDGFGPIANVDISKVVIDTMSARHKDKANCTWQVMNVMSMNFQDSSFDAVLDKGTLDSLLCGDSSTTNSARYLKEVARVLKPGGVFVAISYGTPENRLQYFEGEEYNWRLTMKTVPKPIISATGQLDAADPTQNHFVYILLKNQR